MSLKSQGTHLAPAAGDRSSQVVPATAARPCHHGVNLCFFFNDTDLAAMGCWVEVSGEGGIFCLEIGCVRSVQPQSGAGHLPV